MGQDDLKLPTREINSSIDEMIRLRVYSGPTPPKKRRSRWTKEDDESMKGNLILSENFWEDFTLLSRVCVMNDPEATIYDVFDTMRTKVLGGWEYPPEYLAKIDAEIEAEENARRTNIS